MHGAVARRLVGKLLYLHGRGTNTACNPDPTPTYMSESKLTIEHRILITMRQVLSSIVRDTTPPPGMRHPLTDSTIEDIKACFALITAREKELNNIAGNDTSARPRYKDEPRATTQVVHLVKPDDH